MTRRAYSAIKCFHASEDSFTVVSYNRKHSLFCQSMNGIAIKVEIIWESCALVPFFACSFVHPTSLYSPTLTLSFHCRPLLPLLHCYAQDFGAHGVEAFQASTPRAFDIMHIVKIYIQQQHILDEVALCICKAIISVYKATLTIMVQTDWS